MSVESSASVTARGSEQGHQARFWADEEADLLATDRQHVIRDSKTPSGDVLISNLRGPIITDALYRTFKKRGLRIRYVFTIDDYDPMDSQSLKEKAAWAEHMGKPFANIPSPEPSAASDFARYYASRFLATFGGLGIRPEEIHWMRDLYRSGQLDGQIDLVLRNAATIREIYARVANVKKDERWLPIGVICENCRRLGTTYSYDYDGETVAYECRPDYVEWAKGCGHSGRISPFKGNAKLYWNLQWCAMWDHFGVTYEEGGKDLLTAGGSRDRANEIFREVWKKDPPIGLVHEFFTTSGGKKMSTSKGLGAAASELVAIYPPELIRFLMLRTHPKRHVEFDPAGLTLPKLMDEYDQGGDAFLTEPESDKAKTWLLSQVAEDPEPPGFRVRFSIVADWLQIPSVDPLKEAEKRKDAPLTAAERTDLEQRIALARVWLERWAPGEARFSVLPDLPDVALSDAQRRYLEAVKPLVGQIHDPEAMQQELYETAKRVGLVVDGKVSRDAFSAIYLAFLGKPSGPKAGWLLTALGDDVVRRRLDEAVKAR
ncbi:MAG TPA: lysine--tRNA ligase [Candidatus Limnocylindria bacterium]|nr:lysine--tRNA ligase [Candidatus Limnocylindria bacterium]